MKTSRIEVSQVIDARPDAIYRVLSNYETEHPKILPKPYFTSLVVEEGGTGAGTVVRVDMSVLGTKASYRLKVSEPRPGSVLVEEDPAAGVRTSFTVTPLDEGARSIVQIATDWTPKAGVAGLLERLVNPPVTRHIYRKELDLLAAYVGQAS